jgi:hypothetical protein
MTAEQHAAVWAAAADKIERSPDYIYEIDYQGEKKKIMSSNLHAAAQLARAVSQSYAELAK